MDDLFHANNEPLKQAVLVEFEGKTIRRKFHNGEWWFAYKDVVEVLTDTKDLKTYCRDLRRKMANAGFRWGEKILLLKIEASDGKSYRTSCFNAENILRLIEEIPSKKAEPLKQKIAQLAYEHLKELNNPDLLGDRYIDYYLSAGYSYEWVKTRFNEKLVRKALCDFLQKHGITEDWEFGALTNKTYEPILGTTASLWKQAHHLTKSDSIRDNLPMGDTVLITLSETKSREAIEKKNAQGYRQISSLYDQVNEIIADTKHRFDQLLNN
jgi:hypothetical protein